MKPRGRGVTLIFSCICRLGSFFGVQILNFNIFGGFQKNEYFWGMKILWIFFGGSPQNWTIIRGHFYAFLCLFLRSRNKMGIFLGVGKISNFLGGCLKFLIFLGLNGRC